MDFSILKKCWGIILWGIFYIYLAFQIFPSIDACYRGSLYREAEFSTDFHNIIQKFKKETAQSVISSERKENFRTKIDLYNKYILFCISPVFIFLSYYMAMIIMLLGIGLILRLEIARKLIIMFTFILLIWFSFLTVFSVEINSVFNNVQKDNTPFYYEIGLPLVLYSLIPAWYFSRKRIKEQFR